MIARLPGCLTIPRIRPRAKTGFFYTLHWGTEAQTIRPRLYERVDRGVSILEKASGNRRHSWPKGLRGLDPSSIRSAEGIRYLAAWPTPAPRDSTSRPRERHRWWAHTAFTAQGSGRPVAFVLEAIVCRQVTLSSPRCLRPAEARPSL